MKKERPLLSDEDIDDAAHGSEIGFWYNSEGKSHPDMPATFSQGAMYARHDYEAHLEKQDALMQGIVDLLFHDSACSLLEGRRCDCMCGIMLERFKEAGFTPTVQNQE